MTHEPEHEQKPKKKGFRHHARKVHGRVTKYLIEKDTIFATVWVFLFIVALGAIPLNLGVINPVKLGLKDFDFNDVTYSNLERGANRQKSSTIDKHIVIVNIGYANRGEIAAMIEKVAANKPKVMGLDALFYEARDPEQDSALNEAFKKNKNLIAAKMLVLNGKEGDTVMGSRGDFIKTASEYASVNLWDDSLRTIRYCLPVFEDYAHKQHKSFAAALVEAYDPEAYEVLEKKSHHNHKIIIDYSRRVDRYQLVEYEDLLNNRVDDSTFVGKIVLFGYINTSSNDIEDKKFTPMNERYAGKSIPDMNGIVVHANIISMALDKNYIKKVPLWGNLLLAVLVCWLHMSFFIHYYLESHIWFHLAAKIAQVLSAFFFIWLGIYLYEKYRLKVDMKFSIVTIILAVDVIYFYEAWAVWMHKKFNYKTVFKPHHH
ncbi:MAG TPA: CHASE2 domain-containing protein [Chitinophagaceae bacterium]|nr:CHASE2 domain-containing protein [Chitinophagaceae bacterium]